MDEFEDDGDEGDLIMQYLSTNEKPTEEERTNPLLYWQNSKFSTLAPVARMYLTPSASSVPCEAMFSISGIILNGRRSPLAPHNFNDNNKLIV